MHLLRLAICLLTAASIACDDPGPAPQPQPDQGADQPADLGPDLDAPDLPAAPAAPTRWEVVVAPAAPEAVRWAADDVTGYLNAMGASAALKADAALTCAPGVGKVVFVGDGVGEQTLARPDAQQWRWAQERCEGGVVVSLEGGGLLGRQYAAYGWLHAAGVRFFHPEQEYVPAALTLPAAQEEAHKPDFTWRSVSLHLTHPLELGDVFRLNDARYAQEGKRYIDWQIKNMASFGTTGWGGAEWADYGVRRGFARSAGFSLHNQQQGGQAIIDPDDPRSEEEQIGAAIDARMGDDPDNYPGFFDFTFNPSEFSEIDDRDAVRQLSFIADHMAERYPRTIVLTTNHGTAGQPTASFGVRFYDLPRFAPPNLGVKVHTLMFYDLFRPAPVYGNRDFRYLYDFMAEEYTTRRLWHFPESAWWLTFDNGIPLYMPITLEARDRDIQGIAYMLSGKLDGHRVFGSGHEWGYWQNEYCSFRMSEDIRYRYTHCLDDMTSPMGAAGPAVKQALLDVIALQERDFIYSDILEYLVGTDPETELAASIGIDFHPLPPTPVDILGWDLDRVLRWEAKQGRALERMAAEYDAIVTRLVALRGQVAPGGEPWFDEILDGVEITGLRARHAREVYGALVTLRRARLTLNPAQEMEAAALLMQAEATTELVRQVVARREAQYRYKPLDRAIAGGPQGRDDENWTVYKYRVHNRAHHVYYYTRIDTLAREAFEGGGQVVQIADTMLAPAEQLILDVTQADWTNITVELGDGLTVAGPHVEHRYAQPGIYTVRVRATQGGQPVTHEVRIAAVSQEENLGFSGKIAQPARAGLIEPVMPGLVVGALPGGQLALGFSARETGEIAPGLWTALTLDATGEGTQPARLVVPVVERRSAKVSTSLLVEGGVWRREAGGVHAVRGDLATQAIIDAIVSVGGFEPLGARRLVAQTLGFTPDTLPVSVPFEVRYEAPMAP